MIYTVPAELADVPDSVGTAVATMRTDLSTDTRTERVSQFRGRAPV